jgi:hypothetical protein
MAFIEYLDPAKWTNSKVYIPGLRRVRTLSTTDTQDVNPAAPDSLYDDILGFQQKLSPNFFPMSYKVIAEREYLVPALSIEGREYLSSPQKGLERMEQEWERRPMYVIEMTELDPGYVYSKRVVYIDAETFLHVLSENYDRKGRLYRTFENANQFWPDSGMVNPSSMQFMQDRIDAHSTINWSINITDPENVTRDSGNIEALKIMK